MTIDRTEQQSVGEQLVAGELSLRPTTPPATLPGYRLDRFLGAGTFGQVWFGHDLNTGRPVAVKFYLHRGGVNWSMLSREVKNLVQLSAERSIVQVLDVGWDAEPPFYVMEFLPNGSLEDLLESAGRLPVHQAVEIFRKICIGLNHCHGRGVLHCDLKPGNILLDSDNAPRLADFGQSRMSTDQSPSLGTLFYMAPEQANLDAAPNASWDVYALGVILYRMLTGKIPHRDDTLINRIDTAGSLPKRLEHYRAAILGDNRPTAHRLRRGVDRELAVIVDRCIAPDREHRFDNVQQVIAALGRREQSKARKPLMLMGIVGPLLLMLVGGIFAALGIVAASDRATRALRTEARASNELAARFAARSLENEMQRYFQLLSREANLPQTQAAIKSLLNSPEMTDMRVEIATDLKAAKTNRTQFLNDEKRRTLDAHLRTRLATYLGDDDHHPSVSTMFITDSLGTIISIALDTPVSDENLSTGDNFAFRTYFHGGREDLDRDVPRHSIQPLDRPHLSAAFQSTATGLWKIAFSMPIYLNGNTDDTARTENRPPDGVFVITTNLGDFESMRDSQLTDQLAVVIEARDGPLRGTVLQHPLMMDQQTGIGGTLAGKRFRIPDKLLDDLLNSDDVNYIDPMVSAPNGQLDSEPWLAAIAPIGLPRELTTTGKRNDETTTPTSDLLVLVQYRLTKVNEPVRDLKHQLLLFGSIALALIFGLTVAMWIYVDRITDPTRFDDKPETKAPPQPSTVVDPTIAAG